VTIKTEFSLENTQHFVKLSIFFNGASENASTRMQVQIRRTGKHRYEKRKSALDAN